MNSASHVRKCRGFTLVELLVVIGIIAVLISILLPSLARARQQALTIACGANLRSIGQGLQLYVSDNKSALPIGFIRGHSYKGSVQVGDGSDSDANMTGWDLLLADYMAGSGGSYGTQTASSSSGGFRRVYYCPAVGVPATSTAVGFTHYTANPRLLIDFGWIGDGNKVDRARGGADFKIPRLGSVKGATEKAVLFDGALLNPDPASPDFRAAGCADQLDCNRLTNDWTGAYLCSDKFYPANSQSWMNAANNIDITPGSGAKDINLDNGNNWWNIRFRHNGNRDCNVLFLDGHVEVHSFTGGSRTDGNRGWDGTVSLTRGAVYVNLTN